MRIAVVLLIILLLILPAQIVTCKKDDQNNGNSTVLYKGTWVIFNFNNTTGEISDFSWNGTELFQNITSNNFTLQKIVSDEDSFEIQAKEFRFEILDDPEASINLQAKKEMTLSIYLSESAEISPIENSIHISWTVINGTLEVDEGTTYIVDNSYINISLTNGRKLGFNLTSSSQTDNGTGNKQGDPNNDKYKDDKNKTTGNDKDDKNKTDKKTKDLVLGNFTGKYLAFEYNLSTERLFNVSFYNKTLFNSLFMENGSFEDQKISNNLFKGDGTGADLIAHDNPVSLIQLHIRENVTVFLNITDSWTLNYTEPNLTLHNDNLNIGIVLEGDPVSYFENVTKSNISIVMGKGSQLQIRIINVSSAKNKTELPGTQWFDETQPIIYDSIAEGTFGGDVTITGKGTGTGTSSGTSEEPEVNVNSYMDDFTITVAKVEDHKITLIVSSDLPDGRIFMISVAKETLNITSDVNILMFLDNMLVPEVENGSMVTTAEAGYYTTSDEAGYQFLISIPHFSEREIVIQFFPTIIPGTEIVPDAKTPVWGLLDFATIIAILIVVLIAGLHLFMSRRED